MTDLPKRLKRFEARVRLVRSWRGLAMGACFGAAACAIWSVLDWRGLIYTEWSWMGLLIGCSSLVGATIGFLLSVSAEKLAASIDRRAGLDDRLTTARERSNEADTFDRALQSDAESKLAGLKPNRVYPVKFGWWHGSALAFGVLAAAIFLLGNTAIVLSPEARQTKEELKKQGQAVERITKEQFETPEAKQEMSDAEKRLANELRKYERDLEKGHMSKEEALQKGNEIEQKADELAKQADSESHQSLEQAQTARENLEKAELRKAGLGSVSPEMAHMSESEREHRLAQAKLDAGRTQKELDETQKKLDEINKKLADPSLSETERKALEAEKKALEGQKSKLESQKQANAEMEKALELSREAQEVFRKMMNDPLYKELIEIEKKLAQKTAASGKGEQQAKMTDQERNELKAALEKLAAQLKDESAMREYLKDLIEAAKKANELKRCKGVGFGLNGLPLSGISSSAAQSQAPPGPGAPTEDVWQGDNHHVYHLDKASENKGTTTTSVISGEQRAATGPSDYVEIKAPSTVGTRSSVPYQNVLPSYKKKAESAMDHQQIPKERQKRVKEYFDSLTGSKKG